MIMWCFMLAVSAHLGCGAGDARDGVNSQARISIGLEVTRDVSQNEGVFLRVVVRNNSDVEAKVEMGENLVGNLIFTMTGPDGGVQRNRAGMTADDRLTLGNLIALGPGQEQRREVTLNNWLRFDRVGSYVLKVEFDQARNPPGSITIAGSPLHIRVRTRDAAYLQNQCSTLVDKVLRMPSSDESFLPSVEHLRWIRDPVAIPCLERAAASGRHHLFAYSLAEIGTSEAKDALNRLLRSPDESVVRNAKAALTRFKPK